MGRKTATRDEQAGAEYGDADASATSLARAGASRGCHVEVSRLTSQARAFASGGEHAGPSAVEVLRFRPFSGRGWVADALVLAGAYLYGSLPLVYALGRERNVDLQRVGSGNVGATNLMAARGPALAAAGWVFDASKGLLPVVAARRMGRGERVAELAGVCGVAGQCWPLFLRFHGGRGVSAYVGATAAVSPRSWPAALLPMIAGGLWRVGGRYMPLGGTQSSPRWAPRSKSMPLACLISMVTYPFARGVLDGRGARGTVAPTLLSLVLIARRLTAALPDDATEGPAAHPKALLFRLLYDRNTSV